MTNNGPRPVLYVMDTLGLSGRTKGIIDLALHLDPARYRPKDDYQQFPLGDPVERLKKHLIGLGEWSEDRHAALTAELEEHVAASWKEAVSYGTLTEAPRLDPGLMFEDVFATMPEHLRRQEAEMRDEMAGN